MSKEKTNINTLLFYLIFILYYLSLFINDLSYPENIISISSKIIKICTLGLMMIYLLKNFNEINKFKSVIILILASVLFIASRDLIWIMIAFISFCSKSQTSEEILRTSYWALFIGTIITLVLYLLGILPDVINYRSSNNTIRHSFGFYHSNVLPGILFYFTAYYAILKKEKSSKLLLFVIFLLNILLFFLCNSKNAFLCTILVLIISFSSKIKIRTPIIDFIIRFVSKNIMLIFFALSFISTYFRARAMHVDILNVFDGYLNGRIYLSALKYNIVGVHFVNFMDSATYFSTQYTIDNGYTYILLRYGVLSAIIYMIVNLSFINRYKNNKFIQLIFMVIAFSNFIDNDFFSYGFLPFLIIGINSLGLLKKGRGKYETRYSIINSSNI